jgi:hypothetical protein
MLSLLAALLVWSSDDLADSAPMACDQGPSQQEIGGTGWLVYACADGRSVVAVTAPDNPAAPFVFIRHVSDERTRLYGEGTGEQRFTQAAFDELSAMTHEEFEAWRLEAVNLHSTNERETEDN